ncbi:MAG: hypothetical protein K8W52_22620 [Deltaproteobacteria bacterium]|nr:hypothetical protein [Deltaproteobacteria bacterium]
MRFPLGANSSLRFGAVIVDRWLRASASAFLAALIAACGSPGATPSDAPASDAAGGPRDARVDAASGDARAPDASMIANCAGATPTSPAWIVDLPQSFDSYIGTVTARDGVVYWDRRESAPGTLSGIYRSTPPTGETVQLYPFPNRIIDLVVDGDQLYWIDGALYTAPAAGGTYTWIARDNYMSAIAVDADALYFAGQNDQTLYRLAKTPGATPLALYDHVSLWQRLRRIGDQLYFSNSNVPEANAIVHAPAGGGPMTVVANLQRAPLDYAVRDNQLYWITQADSDGVGGAVHAAPLDGPLATLVEVDDGGVSFAHDGAALVWGAADQSGVGVIRTIDPTTHDVTTLATGIDVRVGPLAFDASDIYFLDMGSDFPGVFEIPGGLMRRSRTTGETTSLVTGRTFPLAIASDADAIYWTETGTFAQNYTDGAVVRYAKATGELTVLAANQVSPSGIAVDAGRVYWAAGGELRVVDTADGGISVLVSGGQQLEGLLLVGQTLYFTDNAAGVVASIATTGGPITTIAQGEPHPSQLVLDDGYLYWSQRALNGRIMRAPVTGGPAVAITELQKQPWDFAIVGDQLLWQDWDGHVVRAPKSGSASTIIASGNPQVLRLGVAFGYYETGGMIYRFPLAGGPPEPLVAGGIFDLDGGVIYYTTLAGMFCIAE